MDGDGVLDIVTQYWGPDNVQVWRFNADMRPDIVAVSETSTAAYFVVLLGTGNGAFASPVFTQRASLS